MITVEELAKIPLFAALGPQELDYLARTVPDVRAAPGEYVVNEGDGRALWITIEGRFEVTKMVDGVERQIGKRIHGELFGEAPMVLNTPFPAAMRAAQASRVIRVDPKVFHTIAATVPEVSAALGAAALSRIEGLKSIASQPPTPALQVIGPRFDPDVHALRSFLNGNRVAFDWLAPDDPMVSRLELAEAAASGPYPLTRLSDGTTLVAPSLREIATALGLSVMPARGEYDVVIIGSGPAGLAAAVYGVSEGLSTVLIERFSPGGQAGTSSRIENYLGFPSGVSGDELASRALNQAKRLGAEVVVTRSVQAIDTTSRCITLDGGDIVRARSLILSMGVTWRRLADASLERLSGKGVYYGAARGEAAWTQGKDVFLIGAGNSAGQAAMFFASHASNVTLLARGDDLGKSMSHYLIEQLKTKPNIRVLLNSEVVAAHGQFHLEALDVADRRTGTTMRHEAAALFVMIGADASTDWLPPELARDANGYVLTGTDVARTGRWGGDRDPYLLETTVPGIFAVADVRAGSVKRIASGVGEGSMAIAFVHKYLQSLGG